MTTRAKRSSAPRLGDWLSVREAQLVILRDAWSGYGAARIDSFELRRDPGGALVGELSQVTDGEPPATRPVSLPSPAAEKLLALLAATPLLSTPYEPTIEHTDDFPDLRLMIYVGPRSPASGFAMLQSQSQGTGHAPWSVSLGGTPFTSDSTHVGRAVAILRRLARPA